MALEQREVSELYVAIFNRASEGEGNKFWQTLGDTKTKAEVAEAMIASPAGQAYLGDSINSNQDFIELIYKNTLGKTVADDAAGIASWVKLLDNGVERGKVITALIEAVQTEESLYPDGVITGDLSDRIPSAVAAQEQFENRVEVSTALADHVEKFNLLDADGNLDEQLVKDVVFATSFTDEDVSASDGNKNVPHGVQGAEGIEGNHGAVEASNADATGSLFVTDDDKSSINAIQDILDGTFNQVGGKTVVLTTGVDSVAGRDDSDNITSNGSDKDKLTPNDDTLDGSLMGSLQLTDTINDPSTDDNDKLDANFEADYGPSDATGDIIEGKDANRLDDATIEGLNIKNIEQITLHTDELVDVVNVDGIVNNINLNIDKKDNPLFNSLNDVRIMEIANLDGDQIQSLNAIEDTLYLGVSDVRNDANIVLKDDFKALLVDAYSEDKFDDSVNIYMEGANFILGLFDDDDNKDTTKNDGGQFQEMTLISNEKDSRVTIAEGTSLNNRTDSTTKEAGQATGAKEDKDGDGTDMTGTEGSMQSISKEDGDENSVLTRKLWLDSEEGGNEDITLVGTGIQFDEAIIQEVDEGSRTGVDNEQDAIQLIGIGNPGSTTTTVVQGGDDTSTTTTTTTVTTVGMEYPALNTGLQSTIELTLKGAKEIAHPVDLTRAEVDLVTIHAMGDDKLTAEFMEVDLDQDSVAEVNYIEDLDTLVLTGDHDKDRLEVVIDTGNRDAALGRLVLGGDASATTTDTDSKDGSNNAAGAGGNEASGGAVEASTDPDLTTHDALSATIFVESDSNLGVLDISQIGGNGVRFEGPGSIRIDELIMGQGGPGTDADPQANTIDARNFTGDFNADLTHAKIETVAHRASDDAHDDGNGVDDNTKNPNDANDNQTDITDAGVNIYLGSGNDFLANVGVVSGGDGKDPATTHKELGWDHGDNIELGAGDDVVEIGSTYQVNNDRYLSDDAVAAEIWGQEGRDTYNFLSTGDTDHGAHSKGTQFAFADAPYKDDAGSPAPVADRGDADAKNLDGISLVQIEDFQVGSGGDQLDFGMFRDVDNEGLNLDDTEAHPELFHYGEIISATSSNNYYMEDGSVVLVSVDDINEVTAESVIAMFGDVHKGDHPDAAPVINDDDSTKADGTAKDIPGVFEDPDTNDSATNSDFFEYVIMVGETSGNDGVKIFYVREGGNALPDVDKTDPVVDHIEANIIGQLNGNGVNDVNITTLSQDNFDFS